MVCTLYYECVTQNNPTAHYILYIMFRYVDLFYNVSFVLNILIRFAGNYKLQPYMIYIKVPIPN